MDEQAKINLAKLRERMLEAGRRKSKTVTFGDAEVVLRQLSALESNKYADRLGSDDNLVRLTACAELVVACTFDGDGNAVFSSEDIPVILDEMGTDGFGDIATAVLELNTHTKKAREEVVKNSEAPASGLLSD